MKLNVFVARDVPLFCKDTNVGKVWWADSFIHWLLLNTYILYEAIMCVVL